MIQMNENKVLEEMVTDLKILGVLKSREKFIKHNNYCILEVVAFYDNFFLDRIIKKYLLTDNCNKNPKIEKIMVEKLNFMDKYKIVKEIAKEHNIDPISQKQFEDFICMRNDIAHNLSFVGEFNYITKQNKIIFGGKEISWTDYLKKLENWVSCSFKMAAFTRNVFSKIDTENNFVGFVYCKTEGKCILVEHTLLFPEPDGDYISFFRDGFDMDLLESLKEEMNYSKGVDPNE